MAQADASSTNSQLQSDSQNAIPNENESNMDQSAMLNETTVETLLQEIVSTNANEIEEDSGSGNNLCMGAVIPNQTECQVTSTTTVNPPSAVVDVSHPFDNIFSELEENAKLVISKGTYKFSCESDYLALVFGQMNNAISGCNEFVESVFYVSLSLMM
jgi:hypothetical protein